MEWTSSSWEHKKIQQSVEYPDQKELDAALLKLKSLPPLVNPMEASCLFNDQIRRLKEELAKVARGEAFLLQGGDCAELFSYCNQDAIDSKMKVLLQMSLVLVWGARTPVVRIARMAGQYAKPRSKPTEDYNGQQILAFRGENVNGYEVDQRDPDPHRLVSAYFHSAATLNYVRGLLNSGFADLHRLSDWSLHHVRSAPLREEYQTIANRLKDSLGFMQAVIDDTTTLKSVHMYTSHEALLLPYESAMTRQTDDEWWDTSAHFVWIGDRTRQVDGAHVELLRGLSNPIGIKIGPSIQPGELTQILDILDSKKEPGKITLITRYGADKISACLPQHIKEVQKSGHVVVWSCDPMHGNTETVDGRKTRNFGRILRELRQAFQIHKENNSQLNGVHFELTGDRVTECVGGSMELEHGDLGNNYQTYCDPRLNYEQSMDMAFLIAKYHEKQRTGLFL